MNKKRKQWLLFSSFVLLLTAIGIAYAWFMQNASMTTLLAIQPPDTITISDADGTDMTELDLDYRENSDDWKDSEGRIHILRPLCIKSTSPIHQLEIVHTTNLKSLKFKIYPATKEGDSFIFNKEKSISGKYENETSQDSGEAKEETLENYADIADVANSHAYPLYWLAVNCAYKADVGDKWQSGWQEVTSYVQKEFDVATKMEKDFYYTYYYLEISWQETTKETDLFYIMARNIAE